MLIPVLKEMVRYPHLTNVTILKAMQTKDFVKFLGLVSILYLGRVPGAATTPRGWLTMVRLQHMLLVLGTGQLHFREDELDPDQSLLWIKLLGICEYCDHTTASAPHTNVGTGRCRRSMTQNGTFTAPPTDMLQISPVLGTLIMFVFVCMTNILLITSLISLLSNKLDKVRGLHQLGG